MFAADADSAPIGQLTQRYPGMEVADAYAIQQVNLARRLASGHAPWWLQDRATSDDADAARRRSTRFQLHPRHHGDRQRGRRAAVPVLFAPVEPEVAFLLRATAAGTRRRHRARAGRHRGRRGGTRIVDSRIADWKLTLPDTVADNASSGAVVLGDWVPCHRGHRPTGARASLQLNGTEIDTGSARRCWRPGRGGRPLAANALVPFRHRIVAGQFIMSGSFTTAAFFAGR